MSDWVDVCSVNELPLGGHALADLDGTSVAVFNLEAEYYAIHDICSHDGAELADGRVDGDQIVCPRHGARFCLKTGQATKPPAYEAIATFPVRVVDGLVQIRDARWD